MNLVKVAHLDAKQEQMSDELIDRLLCAAEWLYRDEAGYVARLPMNKVFKQPCGYVTYNDDFQAGIIAWFK